MLVLGKRKSPAVGVDAKKKCLGHSTNGDVSKRPVPVIPEKATVSWVSAGAQQNHRNQAITKPYHTHIKRAQDKQPERQTHHGCRVIEKTNNQTTHTSNMHGTSSQKCKHIMAAPERYEDVERPPGTSPAWSLARLELPPLGTFAAWSFHRLIAVGRCVM